MLDGHFDSPQSDSADVHFLKKPLIDKQGLEKVIVENGGSILQRIVGEDEGDGVYAERIVIGTDLKGCESAAPIFSTDPLRLTICARWAIALIERKGARQSTIVIPEWVLNSVQERKVLPLTKESVSSILPDHAPDDSH